MDQGGKGGKGGRGKGQSLLHIFTLLKDKRSRGEAYVFFLNSDPNPNANTNRGRQLTGNCSQQKLSELILKVRLEGKKEKRREGMCATPLPPPTKSS